MRRKVANVLDYILYELGYDYPVPRFWVIYFGSGAVLFGLLSYPSQGTAFVLIPMFLASGIANLYACLITPLRDKSYKQARKIVIPSMALMILASWTRGILILGVNKNVPGHLFLATSVWLWITVGCIFLIIAVWERGLR